MRTAHVALKVDREELEQLDRLAAEVGCSRAKLTRAAMRVICDLTPAAARARVQAVPDARRDAQGERDAARRRRLLAALPTAAPGLTRTAVEGVVGKERSRLVLRELLAEGLVVRDGPGNRWGPYRYRRAPAHDEEATAA